MDTIEKLLDDSRDEKITIADPVEVWIDIFIVKLSASGRKGVIKIPSKLLHEMYVEWVELLNEQSYLYSQIQFMVRLARLKIDGIKTGIHTRTCKVCSFDMDIL